MFSMENLNFRLYSTKSPKLKKKDFVAQTIGEWYNGIKPQGYGCGEFATHTAWADNFTERILWSIHSVCVLWGGGGGGGTTDNLSV